MGVPLTVYRGLFPTATTVEAVYIPNSCLCLHLRLPMHELAVAQSIIASAKHELDVRQAGKLKEIGVRIGALSGVLPDALDFSFEAITIETDLEDCVLRIEHLPVIAACADCAEAFEVANFLFACPKCNSGSVKVTQGYELEIAYLEVEDNPESHRGVDQNVDSHVQAANSA